MRLTKANRHAIGYACRNFHYSKSVPATIVASYNVYNDDEQWCGVVVYGAGATPNLGKQYGLIQGQIVELCRVALNGKQEHTSQAVAMSLKQLHHDKPMCRLVVSYADCDQSHLGTIYQATNWVYVGNMEGQRYFVINGKKTHPRTIGSHRANGGGRCIQSLECVQENFDKNAAIFYSQGKRKYLMPMDKAMRKQIAPLAKPYPKNDDWVKIDRRRFKDGKRAEPHTI